MIVDCEIYLVDKPILGRDYNLKELLKLEREANVDKAIIMPPSSVKPNNEKLAKIISGSNMFIGCAWINPHFIEAPDELEIAVTKFGFKGLKLMPTTHGFRISSEIADPIMNRAEMLGIPVTIHSGTFFCHPLEIALLAERFPKVPIIMDHMGYRYYTREAIAAAKKCKNIFLATTCVAESYVIKQAVEEIGSNRVIFGSNGPYMVPKIQIDIIREAKLNSLDEERILGLNAMKLYDIE